MKTVYSKQKTRIEKKKKKLVALANIVKLNDKEKGREIMSDPTEDHQQQNVTEQNGDDGFIKVAHKKKKKCLSGCFVESSGKRQKVETQEEETFNDNLTDKEYKQIQKQLVMRKRKFQKKPDIRLCELGQRALLSVNENERTPIFLTDVQHLVMFALLGKNSPCTPDRWCFFDQPQELSHTVVLCLEGLSLFHYLSNEGKFVKMNVIFENKLETLTPKRKREEETMVMLEEFTQVPLTNAQAYELIEKHGSLEAAVELNKDSTLFIKGIFPVDDVPVDPASNDLHPNDKFPRTKLLLSALQMVDEGYPLPLKGELNKHFARYVMTKDKYVPVTNRSPLFAVDCEMCRTSIGVNELTRISIVNEECETVYETLVMPDHKIVNYLTNYSGITEDIMMTVTKKLKDVQKEVRELLPPDAILVGQSLNSDLNAMRMMHPYVIDTSVCFNISGVRNRKSKLQKLAITFLKENIQQHKGGHDSVEDSISSLKLVKLKLANSVEFGDEVLTQKKRFHDIIRVASGDTIKNNLLGHASRCDKKTAIITAKSLPPTLQVQLKKAENDAQKNPHHSLSLYELSSNREAARKCREISLENALTLCHFNLKSEELEASSFDTTVEYVDKWVSKIWKNMANNGLLVVLMGGAPECSSGVAKIAIKRSAANVATNDPITA